MFRFGAKKKRCSFQRALVKKKYQKLGLSAFLHTQVSIALRVAQTPGENPRRFGKNTKCTATIPS
jgi:hypothetical protein